MRGRTRTHARQRAERARPGGSGCCLRREPREFCRGHIFEGARQHLIPSKEPDADDSAVPERSLQPERSAQREATSAGGGAPAR